MATPVTIYYESTRNATKEDRKRSLTPTYVDGIFESGASFITDGIASSKDWVSSVFEKPNAEPEFGSRAYKDARIEELKAEGLWDVDPVGFLNRVNSPVEDPFVVNTLAFHAVIGETHSAQTEITKFPTQAGFEISNHAIRKNRVIEIEAIISNTLLNAVGSRQLNYGLDNSVIVFEAIEALINSATVCTVSTNLGIYWPVVFTKFRTKQELGMVDSLKFILTGEEILIQETLNKTAPKQLTFTQATGSECDALASNKVRDGYQLECACNDAVGGILDSTFGIDSGASQGAAALQNSLNFTNTSRSSFLINSVNNSRNQSLLNSTSVSIRAVDSADLREENMTGSTATRDVGVTDYTLGEDFQVQMETTSGKPYTVTYKVLSYDFVTSKYKYEVHTDDLDVYVPPTDPVAVLGVEPQFLGSIKFAGTAVLGAAPAVAGCALAGAADMACGKLQDLLDTGMGKLRESIYGAVTDVVNMGGIDGSDSIMGSTLDCVSSQAYGDGVGFEEGGDLLADDIDNATSKVASGAIRQGGAVAAKGGEFVSTSIKTKLGPEAGRVTKELAIPPLPATMSNVHINPYIEEAGKREYV